MSAAALPARGGASAAVPLAPAQRPPARRPPEGDAAGETRLAATRAGWIPVPTAAPVYPNKSNNYRYSRTTPKWHSVMPFWAQNGQTGGTRQPGFQRSPDDFHAVILMVMGIWFFAGEDRWVVSNR